MRYKPAFLALLFLLLCSHGLTAQEFIPAQVYGGKQQLREFIKEELYYPEKARHDKTEGTVVLSFTVKSDGSVENLTVAHPVSPELDAEAVRIFGKLLWEPAQYHGAKVDDKQTMEIPFKLNKYKRCIKQRGYDKIIYPFTPVDTSLKIFKSIHLDEKPKPVFKEKGMDFNRFISKNLTYPEEALRRNIQGTVEIFFVIEPSGLVSNVNPVRFVGAGCTQEAIRLIKMIKWLPGVKNGKAVRTQLSLKISFNLENYKQKRYISPNNANQI